MMDYVGMISLGLVGAAIGYMLPGVVGKMISLRTGIGPTNALMITGADTAGMKRLMSGILLVGVWVFAGIKFGGIASASLAALLMTIALAITVIDWRIHKIPNELVLLMLITGIAFQILHFGLASLPNALLSMVVMMAVFLVPVFLGGFDKIGAGDVKLAGVMGLVLGRTYIVPAVMVMCGALLVYCVIGLFFRKLSLNSKFAFAPFMMLGMGFAITCI